MIKIKPSKKNTNKHTKEGMELLETSIDTVGVIESISVTAEGTIISGHARKTIFDKQGKTAKEIHLAPNEYPVIVTDIKDNTKEYYQAQILANTTANHNFNLDTELINEIAVEYDIDIEELGVEVEEVQYDLEAKEDDFDTTPPAEPITVLGDLYEIGEHRLLCGDSTDSDQVAKLMNGQKADMVFTDPPYGIDIVANNGKVGGDNKAKNGVYSKVIADDTTDTAKEFYQTCQALGFENYIIWGGNYFTDFLPPSMCWIVWDKENTGNFADVELAWTSFDKAAKLYKWQWNGMIRKGDKSIEGTTRVHPTQKPVGLFGDIFNDFQFEICFDGFLGSGSTMVAAHQLKRKCYGMELDPKYCDVIIKRMIKLDDTLTIKRNGIDCKNEFI